MRSLQWTKLIKGMMSLKGLWLKYSLAKPISQFHRRWIDLNMFSWRYRQRKMLVSLTVIICLSSWESGLRHHISKPCNWHLKNYGVTSTRFCQESLLADVIGLSTRLEHIYRFMVSMLPCSAFWFVISLLLWTWETRMLQTTSVSGHFLEITDPSAESSTVHPQ